MNVTQAGSIDAQMGLLPRQGVGLVPNSSLHCSFPDGAAFGDVCHLGCIDGYEASDVIMVSVSSSSLPWPEI